MCDFSGKLIAWMDRELPDDEAAGVERHVRECSECRGRVEAYEQVSRAFNAYCEVTANTTACRRSPHWVPVLSSAAAVAVLLVMFQAAVVRPVSVKPIPARPQLADASPAVVREAPPGPVEKVHRRHGIAPGKTPGANWLSAEPVIQISIPAEAMFPPGAIPEGTTFIAEVRMAADGSVQGLRLQ
jgi:anti-sigma factor RsiW